MASYDLAGKAAFSQYSSGQILAYFTLAKESGMEMYVEYLTKKNILKPMTIKPRSVEHDYAIVNDLSDSGKIKRLNFNGVFRMGLENRNA